MRGFFALCFALFGTFHIDAVYLALDRLTGLSNLPWFLSYVFLSLTVYRLCILVSGPARRPRWLAPFVLVTILLSLALYPTGPGSAPQRLDNDIPRGLAEFLFMVTPYSFAVISLVAVPLRTLLRSLRYERDLLSRLRTLSGAAAVSMAVAFFACKSGLTLSGFLIPALGPIGHLGNRISMYPVAAMCALWPLYYAPTRWYVAAGKPVEHVQKLRDLRELRALRARLDRLGSSRLSVQAGGWDVFRNPDYHLYRTVIDIADGQRTLSIRWKNRTTPAAR